MGKMSTKEKGVRAALAAVLGVAGIAGATRNAEANPDQNADINQNQPPARVDYATSAELGADERVTNIDSLNSPETERQQERLPMPTFTEVELNSEEFQLISSLWGQAWQVEDPSSVLETILASGGVAEMPVSFSDSQVTGLPDGKLALQIEAAREFTKRIFLDANPETQLDSFKMLVSFRRLPNGQVIAQVNVVLVEDIYSNLNPGTVFLVNKQDSQGRQVYLENTDPKAVVGFQVADETTAAQLAGNIIMPDGSVIQVEAQPGQLVLVQRVINTETGRGEIISILIPDSALMVEPTAPTDENGQPTQPTPHFAEATQVTTPERQRVELAGMRREIEVADEYSFSPNDKFEMVANPAGINPILQITDQNGKVFQFETTSLRAFNHEKGIFEDPSIDTITKSGTSERGKIGHYFTGIVVNKGIETLQLPDLDGNAVNIEFNMITLLLQNNQGRLVPVKFLKPNYGENVFAVSLDGQNIHDFNSDLIVNSLKIGYKVQFGTANVIVNDAVRQTDNKAAQAYIAAFTKSPDAAYNIIKLGDQSLPGFYDEEGVLTVAPFFYVVLNKDLVDLPETN